MKIDEVRVLHKQFHKEYKDAFRAVGNNLALGIGKDRITGEFTLEAHLTNDKLKTLLPEEYHGIKVNVVVIGAVKAL
jgi:hypothetical protein